MSAAPMRSVIRVLSDSPVVERISHVPETNRIQVVYKRQAKNTDSVKDVVDMLNFYFEKLFNTPEALEFVCETDCANKPEKKRYYINTFAGRGSRLFRIDIQQDFVLKGDYYESSKELVDVELLCLENAKTFIIKELGSGGSKKRAIIEFNYANVQDPLLSRKYEMSFRDMPNSIVENAEISLARIKPTLSVEEINRAIVHASATRADPNLSVFYDKNLDFVEKLLRTDAKKLFVTMDFKKIGNLGDLRQTQKHIRDNAGETEVYFVMRNVEPSDRPTFEIDTDNFLFYGRQMIEY